MSSTLVRYFEEGIKEKATAVGLEVEHFILDAGTHEAVPYAGPGGVREVVEKLMAVYPETTPTMGEDLLGFVTPEFTVTLEPAAQLEISIFPKETIRSLGEIYRTFLDNLDSILAPMGLVCLPVGCTPESRVDELTLIPKERYRLMDRHFQTTGTGGREMMRGSCSVQVSIDFTSVEDFRLKVQAVHYLVPFLMLIADNASRFQGQPLTGHMKRSDIWARTDPARCGILPNVFKEDYDFSDYAAFLEQMPLIFREVDGKEVYTGQQTVAELFADREPDPDEVLHILSMAFPQVRLKHYLEIRVADSMPYPYVLAYAALIKGLLYVPETVQYFQTQIRALDLTADRIRSTIQTLRRDGWDGSIYGCPARIFAENILSLAAKGLNEEEQGYLSAFDAVVEAGGIQKVSTPQGE